jgi:hypothetical protein
MSRALSLAWKVQRRAQPVQVDPGAPGATAEHDRAGGAVEFGDGHHDGALHRQQPALRAAPLVQRLELHRVRGQVRHVEPRQHLFGRLARRCRPGPPTSEKPVSETTASTVARPSCMKKRSMAGRASSPAAKAGTTRRPRASHGGDHAVVVAGVAAPADRSAAAAGPTVPRDLHLVGQAGQRVGRGRRAPGCMRG